MRYFTGFVLLAAVIVTSIFLVRQEGPGSQTSTPEASAATPGKVLVSEQRFNELFRQICTELLVERGTPLSSVYQIMLRQYDGQKIDEDFVRALLKDLKSRKAEFDGKGFHGFSYTKLDPNAKAAPEAPLDLQELKKDTISVERFLLNPEWYSTSVFQTLTKQNKVRFALKIDKENRFVFEALEDMSAQELLAICTNGGVTLSTPTVLGGQRVPISAANLRHVPRIFEFAHAWTDHLGQPRTVQVALDLSLTSDMDALIERLPDGTIVKDDRGRLLTVSESVLFVRRVEGEHRKTANGWQYIDGGKVVIEAIDNEVVRNVWGDPAKTSRAVVATIDGKDVLEVEIDEGVTNFKLGQEVYRSVTRGTVTDGKGQIVTDPNDIANKWISQGRTTVGLPNLAAYVDIGPLVANLARTICAWYSSDSDRKNGLLKFVQSFKYESTMFSGKAKRPFEALLSKEMDCRDASVFAVSLFVSAGFPAGFLYLESVDPDKPGHAVPLVDDGRGQLTYAEPTDPDAVVGQKQYYKLLGFRPVMIHRYGDSCPRTVR